MNTETQLFPDNDICGGNTSNMCADHYSKILFKAINELLANLRCFVKFWEPGETNTMEEYGNIEEYCTILRRDCKATCIINVASSDCP